MDEEEKIVKGDDVIVELEATLEDLYMGGTMKVSSCFRIYFYVCFPSICFKIAWAMS